eukprot:308900_1
MISNCPERLHLVIIMDCIAAVLFILATILSIVFIFSHKQHAKADCKVHFLSIIFLALNISIIGCYIPYQTRCKTWGTFWELLWMIQSSFQIYLLVVLWYYRFTALFSSSVVLRLSKRTTGCFHIYFIFAALVMIVYAYAAYLYVFASSKYITLCLIIVGIAFTWLFCGIISLSFLFIKKLIQAYKWITNDPSFISIITKYVILTVLSLSITILQPLFPNLRTMYPNSIIIKFTHHYVVLLDAFTNCLYLILSFSDFDIFYQKICGCVHKRFQAVLLKKITVKEKEEPNKSATTPVQFEANANLVISDSLGNAKNAKKNVMDKVTVMQVIHDIALEMDHYKNEFVEIQSTVDPIPKPTKQFSLQLQTCISNPIKTKYNTNRSKLRAQFESFSAR